MENAVQALKMAAAVIIFIVAITTSFTMFSRAKATTDTILKTQDRQAYLDSPEVKGGILYTSSEDIESGDIATMTTEGNRIVKTQDVISTLYRYWLEQYNVTIIKDDKIITRFDSDTETKLQKLPQEGDIIDDTTKEPIVDKEGNKITVDMALDTYAKVITNSLKNLITVTKQDLRNIYKIESKSNKDFGAPWLGGDTEVKKRINAELEGEDYIGQGGEKAKISEKYSLPNDSLKKLLEEYSNPGSDKKITEYFLITDNSKYLKDNETKTNLLLQNEHPTLEVVYVLK